MTEIYEKYEDEFGNYFYEIPLTKNKSALVSEEDLPLVEGNKWHYTNTGYAGRRKNGKIELMHRVILDAKEGEVVDHINRDRLDNRRGNIRIADYTINAINRPPQPQNTSGYKGVSWDKEKQKWHAYINKDRKRFHLGYFSDKESAAEAYNVAAMELYGDNCYLNIINKNYPLTLKIKKLSKNAVIPVYAHEFDSGFDLVATEDVIIEPGETALIPTGIAVELPSGYELQVRPRSGITLRTKLRVQLGTVDSNYRGEVGVIVDNTLPDPHMTLPYALTIDGGTFRIYDDMEVEGNSYIIRKGEKIAQAVIAPVVTTNFAEVDELSDTTRGESGFGSTGVIPSVT